MALHGVQISRNGVLYAFESLGASRMRHPAVIKPNHAFCVDHSTIPNGLRVTWFACHAYWIAYGLQMVGPSKVATATNEGVGWLVSPSTFVNQALKRQGRAADLDRGPRPQQAHGPAPGESYSDVILRLVELETGVKASG
jgi:hypothetical protein